MSQNFSMLFQTPIYVSHGYMGVAAVTGDQVTGDQVASCYALLHRHFSSLVVCVVRIDTTWCLLRATKWPRCCTVIFRCTIVDQALVRTT